MLISVVARSQAPVEVDRYAPWLAALRRLRDEWAAGSRPEVNHLQDYLDEVGEALRSEALQDLIGQHLRLAWPAGVGKLLEAYIQAYGTRFPTLRSPAVVPAELIEEEFLARHLPLHGEPPALQEYEARFPGRTDAMRLMHQRLLGEARYVKLRSLGQGTMGKVWEAYDRHLCRAVAIKEPRSASAGDPEALRRFAEEARVTAALEHPGVAAVHEFQASDQSASFYVMRLVQGATLGELIAEDYRLQDARTTCQRRACQARRLRAFQTVCHTVAYAHSRGVLHRDLKPGNIVVGPFGDVVIVDWGLATRLDGPADPSRDQSDKVAGTPEYMPPEQAQGMADVRSDVFGLGAVLYEVLTGRAPRGWPENARPADWQRKVHQAQIVPPRQRQSTIPRALDAICRKALARNADDRYQSAGEVAEEIARYLAGQPVLAQPERLITKALRWIGRRADR